MKRIVSGGIILFAGVALTLGTYIPAAKYSSTLGGWNTPPGRLGTALDAMGGTELFYFSIVLIILGLIFLIIGSFEDLFRNSKRHTGSKIN